MTDRPIYYNRQGEPLSLMEWARSYERSNPRVAQDSVGLYWDHERSSE